MQNFRISRLRASMLRRERSIFMKETLPEARAALDDYVAARRRQADGVPEILWGRVIAAAVGALILLGIVIKILGFKSILLGVAGLAAVGGIALTIKALIRRKKRSK